MHLIMERLVLDPWQMYEAQKKKKTVSPSHVLYIKCKVVQKLVQKPLHSTAITHYNLIRHITYTGI